MSHVPAPSSGQHCSPCEFGGIAFELEQQQGDHVLGSLTLRQIQLIEQGSVRQSIVSQEAVQEKLDLVHRVDPGSIGEKRIQASLSCAQRIMSGECTMFMVRRKGPQAGALAQKLTLYSNGN